MSAGQDWIDLVIRDCCEIPRDSPEDMPDAIVVLPDELRMFIESRAPDLKYECVVLHCPRCGTQYIDVPQLEREHQCQDCCHVWRPADVATVGVAAIATHGSRDGPPKETP